MSRRQAMTVDSPATGPVADSRRSPGPSAASRVLTLQASVGNRAVGRLLSRSGVGAAPAQGHSTPTRKLMRWDSFEHVELGDQAPGGPGSYIDLSCHDRDFPERGDKARWPDEWRKLLQNAGSDQLRAATMGLTYGEVVALSGDFYGAFTSVDGQARTTFDALDTAPLTEIVRLIPLIRSGHAGTEQLQEVSGGRYLALAKQNVSHFSNVPAGKRNIDVWHTMHAQALELARRAAPDTALARRAWGINAAADHFLTDAFSGGHLRQPRAEMIAAGTSSQIESKVLHDLDNAHGVEVTDGRGDRPWIAYGDDSLDAPADATNRAAALEAVRLSKQDISDALAQGPSFRVPATFAAESLVPIPVHPNQNRWSGTEHAEKWAALGAQEGPGMAKAAFNDDDQVRAWVSSVSLTALGAEPLEQKNRMIDTLLSGWISDDDLSAIRRICQSVTTAAEMAQLRSRWEPEINGRMTDLGDRIRFRAALRRL